MPKIHTFREHGMGEADRTHLILPGWEKGHAPFSLDFPKRRDDQPCVQIIDGTLTLSYYIGLDWIKKKEEAIQVSPKVDGQNRKLDYLGMLFEALGEAEALAETEELFLIKFDQPFIKIPQQEDELTPLLMVSFLRTVQHIVRKGLRRSYYAQEENLLGRVKGKVLVAQTLKQNTFRQRPLHTACRYDTFGTDGLENRLLKKTLQFVRRYLDNQLGLPVQTKRQMQELFSYIMPAFATVSTEVSLQEIKHTVFNPFYREYAGAIRLARLILQRFGYKLIHAETSGTIATPPFWIDMSKLFELYVLKLLREAFGKEVRYQFHGYSGYPDFLLTEQQVVVDAKYKMNYSYQSSDIRQVSGYARDQKILAVLGNPVGMCPDCWIIYPNQEEGHSSLSEINSRLVAMKKFHGFYRLGVQLPMVGEYD